MASFFIMNSSLTPQTLNNGENGFVSTTGTLYSETTEAVSIDGNASLVAMGTIATSTGTAAVTSAAIAVNNLAVTVGAAGAIVSGETDAMRLTVNGNFQLTNAGLISGDTGVWVDGGTNFSDQAAISNTGQILGRDDPNAFDEAAITFGANLGLAYVSNDGTIQMGGALTQGVAIAHLGEFTSLQIENRGTIASIGLAVRSAGYVTLQNSGVVQGGLTSDVFLFVNNTGTIITNGYAAQSDGGITVENTGHIDGFIAGALTNVSNSGSIDGQISIGYGGTIRNTGSIVGDILGSSGVTEAIRVENAGTILGLVMLGGGNDTFDGRGGTLSGEVRGGAGNDTYYIDSDTRITDSGGIDTMYSTVSTRIGVGVETLVLEGAVGLAGTGRGSNDTIAGTEHGDTLRGASGDDYLIGGDGENFLYGGLGNDSLTTGYDSDYIRGGDGNDLIYGGGGADTLLGDEGNDRFVVSAGTVTVSGGQGIDTLDLSAIGGAAVVTLLNRVTATDAGGTSLLNTTLSSIENVTGTAFADTVTGTNVANLVDGGLGNDSLNGANGDDTIIGGLGQDTMDAGNGGFDVFVFNAVAESGLGTAADLILNFQRGADVIDLSLIDADLGLADDQAFAYIGTAAFSGSGAQVRHSIVGTTTVIELRLAGSGANDSEIVLNAGLALTAANFLL